MSSLRPLHQQAAQHFDERFIRKQSESFLSQSEHTIWVSRHRTLRIQYLHLGLFLWKQYKTLASYKTFASCKVFIYVLLYSHQHSLFFQAPTYWNCHLQKRLLPDEVFYWLAFPFLGAGFANISLTFFFMWSSNKVFKDMKIFWTVHSRPFIRYQGKNLDWFWICCYFQYFLNCLVQPNQDIDFLLHVIFIARISQTVNLYFLCF